MRSIHSLLIATALFLYSANLFAQSNNATLFGKVNDETGKPVELANISLKNSSIGTVSNRNGEYLLRIPAKKKVVMVYSIIGYGSVEKTITASEEQRIEMNVT
ncbi:MAG: carboxypeptidase-like regulatory domain-containing protein, partial [Bacteroidia bacterium]